jgi:hypothetical protein
MLSASSSQPRATTSACSVHGWPNS